MNPVAAGLRADGSPGGAVVRTVTPRLGWQSSGEFAAFRVGASTSAALLLAGDFDLWDSGDRPLIAGEYGIRYDGRSLESRDECWWAVQLRADSGTAGDWSEPAWFEVPLLDPTDWAAEWITWPTTRDAGALYFLREFDVARPVVKARLYGSALGCGEFWINGHRVGRDILGPAQTDPATRVLYATSDVTDLVVPGANLLGAVAAPAWAGECSVIAQLELVHDDGSTSRVVTGRVDAGDPIWLVGAGPETSTSIFDGERFDARLRHQQWTVPDADRWGPMRELGHAHASSRPTSTLHPQVMEPAQIVATLPAMRTAAGPAVFDVGRNIAGWCRVSVRGRPGEAVRLRYGETLADEGTVSQLNLRSAKACDEYLLAGDGVETWEPRFTVHGFRYVEVETDAEIVALEGRLVRTAMARTSQFSSTAPLVNAIDELVVNTEEANVLAVPTDCPQRDERMGWLNDMTARAEELVHTFDAGRFLSKWVDDIADTQRPDGAIADTAPYRLGVRPADPIALCFAAIPVLLHTHYGDAETARRHFDNVRRWADFLHRSLVEGVLPLSYYGDWAPPASASVGGEVGGSALSVGTPGELVSTAHYAGTLTQLARIARIAGADATEFEQRRDHVRTAFDAHFWAGDGYGSGNQACQAIALYFGLVPAEKIDATVRRLVDEVENAGHHLTTGNLATKYLLEVLCDHGHGDDAYRIVTQTSYPSWGYMLAHGATTIWERWEHLTTGGMNSHNHAMYASVGAWLHRYLAGVRLAPEAVGYSRVEIAPVFPTGLGGAATRLQTVRGTLACRWQADGDEIQLDLTLPVGCGARVNVPGADPTTTYRGRHQFRWHRTH